MLLNPDEFTCERAGRPRRQPEGYWAFLPAPPPTEIAYSPDLVRLLSEADAVVSELSGLGRYLPNPDLLIEPYMRREAVSSSRIEGTRAGLDDLLLDELAPQETDPASDVQEIRNYVAAMRLGIQRLPDLPLSNRLVKELHEVLMREVRGDHATPGEFRRTQNWIGPPGCMLTNATYVPPPVEDMHRCLAAWERFVHRRNELPDLVQCAIMHEHFEAIHPFIDGNGRVGRLLITLFLIERQRLSKPLLYLSSYIEQHKGAYYEHLQRIRTTCEWENWIRYFLMAVRESARAALVQGDALLSVRHQFQQQLRQHPRALVLLDRLFLNPYVTVARAADVLSVTSPTASKTIDRMVKVGVLEEVTGRDWGRRWAAKPILEVLRSSP